MKKEAWLKQRTVFGPRKKRAQYEYAINIVLKERFTDEWGSAADIAYWGNKYVSGYWAPLSGPIVGAILRLHIRDGLVEKKMNYTDRVMEYRCSGLCGGAPSGGKEDPNKPAN